MSNFEMERLPFSVLGSVEDIVVGIVGLEVNLAERIVSVGASVDQLGL